VRRERPGHRASSSPSSAATKDAAALAIIAAHSRECGAFVPIYNQMENALAAGSTVTGAMQVVKAHAAKWRRELHGARQVPSSVPSGQNAARKLAVILAAEAVHVDAARSDATAFDQAGFRREIHAIVAVAARLRHDCGG
jgi:hypothetical protein